MIAYLKGQVFEQVNDSIILISNGIGWDVKVGFSDILPGTEIELFIHTQMRESDITLWGFKSRDELKLFRMLTNVSGVGGKTAMVLIREKGISGIFDAVLQGEAKNLKVSGVGQKTAEKIFIEIKDKLDGFNFVGGEANQLSLSTNTTISEAMEALESLGYKSYDISNAIKKLDKEYIKDKSVQEIIKSILKII